MARHEPNVSEMFLDGRVRATQAQTGFRSGTDAVMLAAAVPAKSGDTVLELGAGAGTASLCLAARVTGLAMTGIEIDPALVALANENAAANHVACDCQVADIFALPAPLRRDFDQVFCNPPFHDGGEAPPDPARARALIDDGVLADWLRLGLKRTVSGGFFTTILRADRVAEALAVLGGHGVHLLPLWPRAGVAAKRTILLARKGSRAPFALLPGLVLHTESGDYTPQAQAILRDGVMLAMEHHRL